MRSDDREHAGELKESFSHAADAAREAFESGEGGHVVAALHARLVDAILNTHFERCCVDVGRPPQGVALVALGGYGRSELCPHSDIDFVLLHRGWDARHVADLNRLLMYPLWDSGREMGNRVRDAKDALRSLDRVDESAAVLDSRLVAGDRGLYLDFEGAVLSKLKARRAGFFRELDIVNRSRHEAFGHAGHLLEPHLRDSAGGLRDVHTVQWAARLLPGGGDMTGLVAQGFLTEADRDVLEQATEVLLKSRIALHLRAGRKQDQLYLPDQDGLAETLGWSGDGDLAPGDAFMRELYRHARCIEAIVTSVWDRVLHGGRRRFRRPTSRPGPDGCVIRDGRLEVVALSPPDADPAPWLRAFRAAMRERVVVARPALNWLQHMVTHGPPTWTAEAREVFVDILRGGSASIGILEAMDSCGFLGALLPEWEHVRALPQRNLYHRYTVDMHGFHAVAELVEGRDRSTAAEQAAWEDVGAAPGRDVPLLLSALLHDVGKGRGGDHSEIGAGLAEDALTRMGFDAAVVDDVVFCVRHHLLLPEVSSRRDLRDERTIELVALRAGGLRRLSMLFLLARADALATGPEAWSRFRSALVRELYTKARRVIERGGVPASDTEREAAVNALAERTGWSVEDVGKVVSRLPAAWLIDTPPDAAARQLEWIRAPVDDGVVAGGVHDVEGGHEVVVVGRDRPGLFATVAGVLTLRGLDVLAADIFTTRDGVAVEVFRVASAGGELPPGRWDSIRGDVASALSGALDLDAKIASMPVAGIRHVGDRDPAVVIDDVASDDDTVVEVHAADRAGLLRTITKALADAGCDIRRAKVATYGVDVVDVFYVRDRAGEKLDEESRRRVRDGVLAALAPSGP